MMLTTESVPSNCWKLEHKHNIPSIQKMWPLFLTEGIYQPHTNDKLSPSFYFYPNGVHISVFCYPLCFHKIQKIMLIGNWPILNPMKLILVVYKPKYPLL